MEKNGPPHNGVTSDGVYQDSDDGRSESSHGKRCVTCIKSNVFLIFLIFGIIVGVVMGVCLRLYQPDFSLGEDGKRNVMYLGFPGDLLLRMLKACIIPLIVSTLISGMASIPSKAAGKLGAWAVLYYLITTFMAVLLGILLVATIQPGYRGDDDSVAVDKKRLVNPIDSLLDLIRNAFPDNLIAACFQRVNTVYTGKMVKVNITNETFAYTYTVEQEVIDDFKIQTAGGTNVLGLVVFSIVLGIIVGQMGPSGLPLKRFVDSLAEAIIGIVRLVIWYSPIGICFLLAARICAMEDPAKEFSALGWYMMTVLVGLAIHGFVVLPAIYLIFTRKNPFKLMLHMGQAILTALGTASSSATLPITLKCLEEKAKVDRRVSRFVLPVGATINMDGTALYEAVASIFIAQVNNYQLDAGQYVTVSLTATAAAIGAAGVPEAGLVTMAIVLTALGLPLDQIGLIFAIDWFLDRFRTSVNVWGDSIGAGVVERLARSDLEKFEDDDLELPDGHTNRAYIHDPPHTTQL